MYGQLDAVQDALGFGCMLRKVDGEEIVSSVSKPVLPVCRLPQQAAELLYVVFISIRPAHVVLLQEIGKVVEDLDDVRSTA